MLTESLATLPSKIRAMQHRTARARTGDTPLRLRVIGREVIAVLSSSPAPPAPLAPPAPTTSLSWSKMVYFLPICFLLIGVGLASCGNSSPIGIGGINFIMPGRQVTKISELQHNKNAAATVYLQGQVAIRAPFLGSGAYRLEDGTGTIWVVTNQPLPNIGDEVLLKGQLQFQSIPVGGQDVGEAYVEEQQQVQRKAGQNEQPKAPQG